MRIKVKRRFAKALLSKAYFTKACKGCECIECAWEAAEYIDRVSGRYGQTPKWMIDGIERWCPYIGGTKPIRQRERLARLNARAKQMQD